MLPNRLILSLPKLRSKTLKRNSLFLIPAALIILVAAAFWFRGSVDGKDRPGIAEIAGQDKHDLGLMTSLPIYWNEGDVFAGLAEREAIELPWVRTALEQRYIITPLDVLSAGDDEIGLLAGLQKLAIVQPRGLSPADNVALDNWVRAGGRLLYVIDPMLSGEYEVSLGDPRHPTVTALVPPVIARWGLELSFDEMQDQNPQLVQWDDLSLPVVMRGILSSAERQNAECLVQAEGIIAQCNIGEGRVTIIADAALFEPREGNAEAESAILDIFAKALL